MIRLSKHSNIQRLKENKNKDTLIFIYFKYKQKYLLFYNRKRMVQWLARFVDDEKTFVQFKLRLIINLLYYYNIYYM